MNNKNNQNQKKKTRTVSLPADLEVHYANLVRISHAPSEFVLDFAQALPGMPNPEIKSRVLMNPLSVKLLYKALGENLAKFEDKFGEIQTPGSSSLAQTLFQPPEED